MPLVANYFRPQTLADALRLLAEPNAAALAGGNRLVAEPSDIALTLVDLQALGLDAIAVDGATITLGAMTRLQAVADHAAVPTLIREGARRAGPNTLRHVATVGGVVATADWESELFAALLVHDAEVSQATDTTATATPLVDFVLAPGGLITAITLRTGGVTAADRVARTPADSPIVAVVGRRHNGVTRLAVCGVGDRPVLVPPEDLDAVTPPADFRGSAAYRRHMTRVLGGRVLARLAGGD